MREGRKIDLTGCNYGETDGCCRFVARPTNYYYFLAGLVKTEKLTYILETGTHCGGSILSMARGLDRQDVSESRLVTVDIDQKNEEGLRGHTHIERVRGDSTDDNVADEIAMVFDRPIDLFYVDSLHEYGHTSRNVEIYSERLKPKYIILDDIHLSEPMERFWREMVGRFKEGVFDASELVGRRKAGFGIIRMR
jgi:cephalosporin hydroxylase